MKTTDTPESDAAWEYAWDEGGCHEGHLLDTMRKLESERNEAREVASAWRENWRNGASMSLIASSKLPWENVDVDTSPPLTPQDHAKR